MMLVDLKLESHTANALYDRAKILGNVSSLEEIYEKKPENCVLVGKIIRIGKLKRKDGNVLRDFFEFSMKELCPDGKYGQDFLVVLFGKIATQVVDAKFMLSDKLIFFNPQVFANPQYEIQQGHRLHVQVGLLPGEVGAIWYSRKHSEELAVVHASPRKLTVSNDNEDDPCCSNSRFAKQNSITATEKNEIYQKNNQYNKNNSIFSKPANWMGKNNKTSSNIINKRLLFARNSENPFLSDSELQHNISHTQTDARETLSPVNEDNNSGERDAASATCATEQSQTVSEYFSRNSHAQHTVRSAFITKPAASECDKRKDSVGGGAIDENSEFSEFSTLFEQVSDVMKQKYLSFAGQSKLSAKESAEKVLEVNRNVDEEVILDGDDDCEETSDRMQQFRNTVSLNNRKTSVKSVNVSPKKTKINNNERPVNTSKMFDKQNSSSAYEKTNKQTVIAMSGDCDCDHCSPEKASRFISKVNNNNNGSQGSQRLNVKKNVDFEDRMNTDVCDRKMVNNKMCISNNQAESNKSCSAECVTQGGGDNVRHKRKEYQHNLELLESLLNEDDEKESESTTTTTDGIALTQSSDAYHEAEDDDGDRASENDNVLSVTTANKTKKLIPAIKSSHTSHKPNCGSGDSKKLGVKKRVSFQLSDEENENVCDENHSSDGDESISLLAGGDCVEIDDVLNSRQPSSKSSGGSRRDCVATQVLEKCSTLNVNRFFGGSSVSRHGETGTKGAVEEPVLHRKSSHAEIQKTLADADSDNTAVERSVEIAKNHGRIQSMNPEEKLMYLNDCVKQFVGKNNCYVKTVLLINDRRQDGDNNTSSSNIIDNILVKGKQNIRTIVVPRSIQDSVVDHVGTKRKHDDSNYDYSDEYNNSDLAKVQRLVPNSQLSTTNMESSRNLEVNCSLLSSVRRDVCVNTDVHHSESDVDGDSDISDDPNGSWSVIFASLIDVYPPLTGDTLDLVSGYCDHNCFHKFTELAWVKNSEVMTGPFCPTAFREGIQRVPQLIFMFTLVVTDDDGKCHNVRVYKEHAEFFLGCKATEYINNEVRRTRIIDALKSYITASTESLTSEMVNEKKLRLCIYNKDGVQVVVKRIRSSTLKL